MRGERRDSGLLHQPQPPSPIPYPLKAFTLIELLLVILLIGIGLMGVVPNLIKTAVAPDSMETFFNDQLQKAYVEAQSISRPVYISGFKNSPNVVLFDGKRVTLPDGKSVLDVRINGERTTGMEYHIAVYPQGVADDFILEFENDETVESIPLMMKAIRK